MLDQGKLIINSNAKAHRERFVLNGFVHPPPPTPPPPLKYGLQTVNKRLCFQNYCIRLCLMYKPICNCLTPRLKSNDNLIS